MSGRPPIQVLDPIEQANLAKSRASMLHYLLRYTREEKLKLLSKHLTANAIGSMTT